MLRIDVCEHVRQGKALTQRAPRPVRAHFFLDYHKRVCLAVGYGYVRVYSLFRKPQDVGQLSPWTRQCRSHLEVSTQNKVVCQHLPGQWKECAA